MRTTIIILAFAISLFAQFPSTIMYQGKITDASGVGINESKMMTFKIYNAVSGGTMLWNELYPAVNIRKGLFNVELGSRVDLDLPFDEEYWLEITIGSEIMTPRQKFVAEAYAFRALIADSVAGGASDNDWSINGTDLIMTPTGNIGIGSATPTSKIEIIDPGADFHNGTAKISIKSAANDSAGIRFCESGLFDEGFEIFHDGANFDEKLVFRGIEGGSSIDHMTINRNNGEITLMGLNDDSSPDSVITVVDGVLKKAAYSGGSGSVAGSYWQISTDIGDGVNDSTLVTDSKWGIFRNGNIAVGNACSTHVNIGNGSTTGAYAENNKYISITGGDGNTATKSYSFVGGGKWNNADGEYAAICGGNSNNATGDYSNVCGGSDNYLEGLACVISGGVNNTMTLTDEEIQYSAIAGGYNNQVQQSNSFIFGSDATSYLPDMALFNWEYSDGALFVEYEPQYDEDSLISNYSFIAGRNMKVLDEIYVNGCIRYNPLVSPPAALEGKLYYDNGSDLFKFYDGTMWQTLQTGTSSGDTDWLVSSDVLFTHDDWGIARKGNILYGDHDSTHINLGVACTTGKALSNSKYAVIGGGIANKAAAEYSTISGGFDNKIYNDTYSLHYCTIGGGGSNIVNRQRSTIAGGYGNRANGSAATVGGGQMNYADSSYTTISGGSGNQTSEDFASIGGGQNNSVSEMYGTIGGGGNNSAGDQYATVAGGHNNDALGAHSAIPGGFDCEAIGAFSFAFGDQAEASSGSNAVFNWETSNGTFFIETNDISTAYELYVDGDAYSTINWVSSDLSLKRDIKEINNGLNIISQLRPVSFKWNSEIDNVSNDGSIGFIAQELQQVLPDLVSTANEDNDQLAVNYSGVIPVNTAAIQELAEENASLKAKVEELEKQNSDILEKLQEIESRLK